MSAIESLWEPTLTQYQDALRRALEDLAEVLDLEEVSR